MLRQTSNALVTTAQHRALAKIALRALVPIVVRHVSVANGQRLAMAMTAALRALVVTQHRVVNSVIVLSALTRRVMIAPHRVTVTTAQPRALVKIVHRHVSAPTVRPLRIVAIVVLQIVNRVRHGVIAPRRAVNSRLVRNAPNAHRSMRRSSVLSAWIPRRAVHVASSRMTCVPSDAAARLPVRQRRLRLMVAIVPRVVQRNRRSTQRVPQPDSVPNSVFATS